MHFPDKSCLTKSHASKINLILTDIEAPTACSFSYPQGNFKTASNIKKKKKKKKQKKFEKIKENFFKINYLYIFCRKIYWISKHILIQGTEI